MASYASAEEIASFLRIEDSGENPEITALAESASRMIDAYCDVTFEPAASSTTARVYKTRFDDRVFVDAISTSAGFVLKTDTSGDGTFDTTWSSTDYQLEPLNQIRAGVSNHAYTSIRAVAAKCFPVSNEARVQVTATFGWTSGTPAPIRDACILLAKDLFNQRNTMSGLVFGETGTARVHAMSPAVKSLIQPFKRANPYG